MTLKTSWFLLHKIRRTFHCIHMEKLDGEVELDETFVGGKNKNRHANKKVKNSQGRSFKSSCTRYATTWRKRDLQGGKGHLR